MYCDHIVVNKWWRNVSPNIAAAPSCDQLAAQQEGVFKCALFCFIPLISLYVHTINKLVKYTMVLLLLCTLEQVCFQS